MNLSAFIAFRYLISKKSKQAVNIITLISIGGVMVGSLGLIIVLSVFNGFQGLVVSLYNTFDPDLSITPLSGKHFILSEQELNAIRSLKGVKNVTEVLEENALLKYREKQFLATIKGVSPSFAEMTGVDSMIVQGDFVLQNGNKDFAVVGGSIADALGVSVNDLFSSLDVFVPKRGMKLSLDPDEAFNHLLIPPAGIFSIQQDFDSKYVLAPLRFVKRLTESVNELSALELSVDKAHIEEIRSGLLSIGKGKFNIKDREQQHDLLYKIMKSEKWAVYLILTFILIIATFNVIGCVTMLILDKKHDIRILHNMGASSSVIQRVFFYEGLLISFSGALIGLILGLGVCMLQKHFELIKMSGSFVVQSYPVEIQFLDFLNVFLTVMVIGSLAAWYPSKKVVTAELSEKVVLLED